ncbi:hypothetical protein MTR_6g033720 [Medicago truncatula]|uniref:Uncharacterized protein n=1 Tax=Medicago truncatula TaxID=3880 RepID=A0A072U7P0_MEDTR|nr:hypothetical protein MTR_6g033720 [Medicago truncatula]
MQRNKHNYGSLMYAASNEQETKIPYPITIQTNKSKSPLRIRPKTGPKQKLQPKPHTRAADSEKTDRKKAPNSSNRPEACPLNCHPLCKHSFGFHIQRSRAIPLINS